LTFNQSLKHKLLKNDIFPLGEYETLPVHTSKDGAEESYPRVVKIRDGIDSDSLLRESYVHRDIIGNCYVKDRVDHLVEGLNEVDLRYALEDVGFHKKKYQSFSLRQQGTAELECWVGSTTREYIESIGIDVFRQQYAVAYEGWNTKLHRDHKDFLTHGFRLMTPLSDDVWMGYEDDNGDPIIYRLEKGSSYFVNIARMHRGFNPYHTERVNLIMQMAGDKLILEGTKCDPLTIDQLSDYGLTDFLFEYDEWVFSDGI